MVSLSPVMILTERPYVLQHRLNYLSFDFSGYLYNIRPLFTANMFLVTNIP